eukprot:9665489-Alexandrium_andersonii.AAC.1
MASCRAGCPSLLFCFETPRPITASESFRSIPDATLGLATQANRAVGLVKHQGLAHGDEGGVDYAPPPRRGVREQR